MKEQSLEQINELNPDLIIASKRQEKMIDKFKEIAPVFNVEDDYTNYYPSFQQNVTALGQIFGKENVAKEKLSALESKADQVAKDAKGKTALLVLVNESKISAFGDGSRYGMVYQKFGFKPIDDSIKSSTHGQSVGFEYILEKNPDFLLVVDRTAAITEKANNAQKVLDNDIIKQTKAYKDGHIVYLDAANWYLAFGGLESMEIIAQELDRAVKKQPSPRPSLLMQKMTLRSLQTEAGNWQNIIYILPAVLLYCLCRNLHNFFPVYTAPGPSHSD